MELGLRLGRNGGSSSPSNNHNNNPISNLHFSLDFSSIPPLNIQQHHHHRPPPPSPPVLHLDLLPSTPVIASRRSSQTDLSEGSPAVFTDVRSTAPPSATAEGGGRGESPTNPMLRSSLLEIEICQYRAATTTTGGGGLFELDEGNNSERACSRGSDEDDQNAGSRKKLRLSRDQSAFLEESFKEHHTLYPKQKLEVARRLNLRPRQVEVWFQNRRARTKLKQTEVDCEYLKKWCETLSHQNTKLRKELQDLRALKTTDSLFMPSPATTLTMCPSCERAAAVTCGKEPVNSKASGFSFTRTSSTTGSFPFSRTHEPSRVLHNN